MLTPPTYYTASAHPAPPRAALEDDIDVDVCVIGAGITGCATALNLARQGLRVALLEAKSIGWGASGRSGGQMIFGYACDVCALEALVGADAASQLWELSLEALSYTRQLIHEHDIQCDLADGHLYVATRERHWRALQAWKRELENRYGYSGLQLLEGDALQAQLRSSVYRGGLLDRRSGHLHPMNYTLGLAAAAEGAGAVLYEHSPAIRIAYANRHRVTTPAGSVRCKSLVFAANAYLGDTEQSLRDMYMPVSTWMLATEKLGLDRARMLIPGNAAVADTNFVIDYFRLSADHRLLFGGGVNYAAITPRSFQCRLRARMLRVFPQLADALIEYSWSGRVAITANRAPHIGRLRSDVYFAQGYSGHGIALAALAGRIMAEAITGNAERFDLFARIPHRRFPGGRSLRTPLLMTAMLWRRLRDLI